MKGTRRTLPAPSRARAPKDAAELAMIADPCATTWGESASRAPCESTTPARSNVTARARILRCGRPPPRSRHLASGADLGGSDRGDLSARLGHGRPKTWAMQIIDELEPVRPRAVLRLGYISDSGDAAFNVAIRTALHSARRGVPGEFEASLLDYSVSAGWLSRASRAPNGLKRWIKPVCARALRTPVRSRASLHKPHSARAAPDHHRAPHHLFRHCDHRAMIDRFAQFPRALAERSEPPQTRPGRRPDIAGAPRLGNPAPSCCGCTAAQ